jgi:hypothetical protein
VSGMGGYTSKCEKSQNHCTLLEIQSFMMVFFIPIVKYCPSNILIGSPLPPSLCE